MLYSSNSHLLTAALGISLLSLFPASGSATSLTTNYDQTNLISNIPGLAASTDPNLVNPWGVSFSSTSPFWISNQGSGTAAVVDGAGNINSLLVTIPGGAPPVTGPTGQVFNGTSGFALPSGTASRFIFDSLNGTIAAWGGGASATTVVTTPGAVYTGLALASSGGSNYLYAADSTGQIRVFNSSFQPVTLPGGFVDPHLPAGYVPFNIQLVGSNLYVTYAQLSAQGTGLPGGFVDEYSTSGALLQRLTSSSALYAPWGLALAPSTFGSYANDLLIGNFGNGEINAFNPMTGVLMGTLDGSNGQPLVNDYLWSLDFRTSGPNVNPDALYFTAGIDDQQGGLFGEISPTPEPPSFILSGLAILALGFMHRRQRRA